MFIPRSSLAPAFLAMAIITLGLSLENCVQTEPGEILEWDLRDSLANYDSVEIVLMDMRDTGKILETVFQGRLSAMEDLKPYSLSQANGKKFIVRIRGFKQGLLAYENRILRTGDSTNSADAKITAPELLPGGPPKLAGLRISGGELRPAFEPDSLYYHLALDHRDSILIVTPSPTPAVLWIKSGKDSLSNALESSSIPLPVGKTSLSIVVHAKSGESRIYSLEVNRALGSEARLSNLIVREPDISMAFHPDSLVYSLSVPSSTPSIRLAPSAMDGAAVIRILGDIILSRSLSSPILLKPGPNSIEVQVTAQDGGAGKKYLVEVFRHLGKNALLSGLALSSGTLTPAFRKDSLHYHAWLPSGQKTVVITASAEEGSAEITINGGVTASGAPSWPIPLQTGTNPVVIKVQAQDATVKIYDLKLTVLPDGVTGL